HGGAQEVRLGRGGGGDVLCARRRPGQLRHQRQWHGGEVGGFAEVGLDAQPACGEEVAHACLGRAEERRGAVGACVGRGVGQGAGLAVEQEELGEVGGQLQARQLLGAQGGDGRVEALHL